MFKKGWRLLLGILLLLFSLFLFPKPAEAQFLGDLGSISGAVRWGTESFPNEIVWVDVLGGTSGYHNVFRSTNFNTGFNLPPDTYNVTASITLQDGTQNFVIGNQTV